MNNHSELRPLVANTPPIRVLTVDDHPLNRTLLVQQLRLLGLSTATSENGTEALVRWQSECFDMIITDCHMPQMDGYELARRIRELEQQTDSKRIPIIAWTANRRVEEKKHCLAAGMDDMLTKSADVHELRKTLSVWLIKTGVQVLPQE